MAEADENILRERAEHPKRTVAVVILCDQAQRMLFVRTKRLPKQWQPVGGGVKAHDPSVEAAAIREILEETGLAVSPEALTKLFETDYDFGEGRVHFFATKVADVAGLVLDPSELEEHRWLTLYEARTLPMFPATEKCLEHLAMHPQLLPSPGSNRA